MNLQISNSLYRPHSQRFSHKPHLEKTGVCVNECRQGAIASKENLNKSVIKSEPVEISFSGSFSPTKEAVNELLSNNIKCSTQLQLSAEDNLFNLLESAKSHIKGDETKQSETKVKHFILKVINHVQNKDEKASDEITQFLGKDGNEAKVKAYISKAKSLINGSPEDQIKDNELKKMIGEVTSGAVDLIRSAQHPSKFFKSKRLSNLFHTAATNENVFSALFAVGLTCFMRPAAIMTLPGQKKNKDDKKYASAHSIASGLIGYAISFLISTPISQAMKKIDANPADYLKENAKKSFGEFGKNGFKSKKAFGIASTTVNMGHEIFIAPGRAMITVAMIPPILKYVFGMEKKPSHKSAQDQAKAQSVGGNK